MRTADDLMARAQTDDRGVALIRLSDPTRDISLETPAAARVRLKQIKPQPYAVERADALPALGRFLDATPGAEIVWLSDGVDLGGGKDFVAALGRLTGGRQVTVISGGLAPAHALSSADNTAGALTVKVLRSATGTAETGTVRGLDLKGLPIADAAFAFKPEDTETEADLTLPVEIRNDIARLEISAEHSAGAVALLDKRWRRRSVGVVTGSTADTAQPLLAPTYYLTRALAPFADVRIADSGSAVQAITQFLDQHLPMMILADVGNVDRGARSDRALDRGRRRAGALRRSPAGGQRRRPRAGAAAARRAHPRRQPVLGAAPATRRATRTTVRSST